MQSECLSQNVIFNPDTDFFLPIFGIRVSFWAWDFYSKFYQLQSWHFTAKCVFKLNIFMYSLHILPLFFNVVFSQQFTFILSIYYYIYLDLV